MSTVTQPPADTQPVVSGESEFQKLLESLEQLRIQVSVKGDKLSISAPKGALTPAITAALKQHKSTLIDHLHAKTQANIQANLPLTVIENQITPALSFGQERMWVLTQWHGDHAAFHIGSIIVFDENLNIPALTQAFEDVVANNASLRALFQAKGGAPEQRILSIQACRAKGYPDLVKEPGVLSLEAVRAKASEDAERSYDLTQELPLRIRLYSLEDGSTALSIVLHHIAVDGWSAALIMRQLRQCFEARCLGQQPVGYSAQTFSYADYAHWLRLRTLKGALKPHIDWWSQQLQDVPSLDVPSDRVRPALQDYSGAVIGKLWDHSAVERIEAFSASSQVTSFVTLLTAFALLIHRYTGAEDFVIGTPVSGRVRQELESIVGIFINMLALRIDCSGQPSFSQMLSRVRATVYDALEHQEAPFEQVVDALQLPRDPSRPPLFQIMFNLERTDRDVEGASWPIVQKSESISRQAALYDLSVNMNMYSDRLDVSWEYATALFNDTTIKAMAGHYERLLNQCMVSPGEPVHTLELLGADELAPLYDQWKSCEQSLQAWPNTVQEQIENVVKQQPQAVAVTDDSGQYSYAQLWERVQVLSCQLQAQGVTVGDRVGIHLHRGVNLIVSLLAVMRTGAAYVPLDPGFPQERLSYMVEDAQLKALVTEKNIAYTLAHENAIDIDEPPAASHAFSPVISTHSDLAYVIYTSGSTGLPKGVEITQGAFLNFLVSMSQKPGCTSQDILLAVTTFSFDIAMLELVLPLFCGAQVVVADAQAALDGAALLQQIEQHRVTIMQATPTTWQLMLQANWTTALPIKLLCGGEALPSGLAQSLLDRADQLWNMYGPTETTIWSACERVLSATDICVGLPIANTAIGIFDANQNLLPVGVPGELCISGQGLARGYRLRDELNDRAFFIDSRGVRWYRTGDRARWRRDGRTQVLGRMDNQIKLRGYRIELGEIEAAIEKHPQVKRAVVVLREDEPGNKRLVSYCIAQEKELPHEQLRQWLLTSLPDYMVPASTVWLAAFPLTPNKKIDRKQLPKPEKTERVITANDRPQTPLECVLAQAFEEALEVDHVGRSDNFFDLGGHSLLSLKVVSQVEERAGVRLHPGELIQQTLGQIAAAHTA